MCSSAPSPFPQVTAVDPGAGFVTGDGLIESPTGAYVPDDTLTGSTNFKFDSKYKKGQLIPSGKTLFEFKTAGLKFESTSYDRLVITGSDCATYWGIGRVNNGDEDHDFMLSACDNGASGVDTFRIKISLDEVTLYDNNTGGISRGTTRIHQGVNGKSGKNKKTKKTKKSEKIWT